MDEYIKREDVLRAYEEEQRRPGPYRFETLIESVPAADVAPVVRCKNCKYFGLNDENVPYCLNPFGLDDPEPNGFCNYGRKTNV